MDLGWFAAPGGLGLFLLGMAVMTEALRALTGASLQRWLARSTTTPLRGAVLGATTTALVQSSSATTVAAVGFVDAGLLRFQQALGIVFGANLGTTVTGWLVAVVGFKLDLGSASLGLVLLGVLARLASGHRTRLRHGGLALAGFGLVFFGIDLLQAGMTGLQDVVTPATLPGEGAWARLALIGIGALVTLVTQSSSAGVAAALAAIHAGRIGFDQAAAMVIGMDVATTVTALLASAGGSRAARRTGLAHVVYNVLTACGAFFLLDGYVAALDALAPGWLAAQPELALVGFHSLFNGLGVVAVLPVAGPFARLVERLVPERAAGLAARLDRRLLEHPEVAMAAVEATLVVTTAEVLRLLQLRLAGRAVHPEPPELEGCVQAATAVREFLDRLPAAPHGTARHVRHEAALHVTDHVARLLHRLAQRARLATLHEDAGLRELSAELAGAAHALRRGLDDPDAFEATREAVRQHVTRLGEKLPAHRAAVFDRHAAQEIGQATAMRQLEAGRWLVRSLHHLWRITHHLGILRVGAADPGDLAPD